MNKKTAIVLINLGTPDEPTTPAVRRYLRQFLSDKRVVELPKWLWQVILNVFVLTTRPKRVAHAYQSIWDNPWGGDSPMRAILNTQATKLQARLSQQGYDNTVHIAMTYGNPNIANVLPKLMADGVERLVILPLYPQYSATSTGAAFDAVMKSLMKLRDVPEVIFIKDYHDNVNYINSLANSIKDFQAINGVPDKLLMSFHGIPKACVDKGDPYFEQCQTTAKLVADTLGLGDDEWAISFQSRFGGGEWIKPYTDETLERWGKQGVATVQIISPAFSADCLETLEELAVENKDNFQKAGGGDYRYIPALNDSDEHIAMMVSLVERYL